MAGRHPTDDYTKWTKDSLIARLRKVESELKKRPARTPSPVPHHHHPPPEPKKQRKGTTQPKLDPSDYNTRYVAFKLAYLGRNYGGFEFASSGSLPSVEEELFKALTRACLIFPKDERVVDFSGLDYSKCGRTDRGVSAFGQVIALRVKSARPVPGRAARKRKEKAEAKAEAARAAGEEPLPQEDDAAAAAAAAEEAERRPFDPINDELPYCKMLNRILPRDIRILAWCPSPPPDFSARFSCRGREYRYFFTQPAFHPPTTGGAADDGQPHPGWLDIDAMRDAARRFEGDHDFRNFCKVDPAKNVLSYRRKIMESAIYEADDMSSHMPHLAGAPAGHAGGGPYPKVYYFKVRGTAFLWHQIRHMVSILFHVGQGLESPDLVDKLLDTETNPRRPTYTMADEIPLVLWDCTFPEVEWRHADADIEAGKASASFGALDGMWRLWREVKMDEILANGLMRITAGADDGAVKPPSSRTVQSKKKQGEYSMRRFEGGNGPRLVGTYKPVMDMLRMGTPQEQNDKFAQRKGFATHEEMLKDRWEKREERNGQSGGE
ncbi:putative tRNA pseudouridine synthase-like protein [Hapsidospora chrysogenum ATCC 11550]|uniref:Putative tRNA pseudouridine synthase-like protein n=1 Tax=Hapsidospora chrysogenum (strain ATCC 11550 / CBS 779.69 / DSM 880 / IAM 14645 / JCM 23072 / IMI 49137) TaxID=857340 RepID=A0A086SZ18_HAPC1|nr:putative tRNA pseudouridine synthase-like protein [Hapsidospora chrysogenum ATCC 11550]